MEKRKSMVIKFISKENRTNTSEEDGHPAEQSVQTAQSTLAQNAFYPAVQDREENIEPPELIEDFETQGNAKKEESDAQEEPDDGKSATNENWQKSREKLKKMAEDSNIGLTAKIKKELEEKENEEERKSQKEKLESLDNEDIASKILARIKANDYETEIEENQEKIEPQESKPEPKTPALPAVQTKQETKAEKTESKTSALSAAQEIKTESKTSALPAVQTKQETKAEKTAKTSALPAAQEIKTESKTSALPAAQEIKTESKTSALPAAQTKQETKTEKTQQKEPALSTQTKQETKAKADGDSVSKPSASESQGDIWAVAASAKSDKLEQDSLEIKKKLANNPELSLTAKIRMSFVQQKVSLLKKMSEEVEKEEEEEEAAEEEAQEENAWEPKRDLSRRDLLKKMANEAGVGITAKIKQTLANQGLFFQKSEDGQDISASPISIVLWIFVIIAVALLCGVFLNKFF